MHHPCLRWSTNFGLDILEGIGTSKNDMSPKASCKSPCATPRIQNCPVGVAFELGSVSQATMAWCLASWKSGVQQCFNLESISKLGRRTHHARRGGRFMVGSLGSLIRVVIKHQTIEVPGTSPHELRS